MSKSFGVRGGRAAPSAKLLVILILLAAFAARAQNLAAQSLWYDEGYTAMFARLPWAQIPALAAQRELNTPLHYLFFKAWALFAGDGEFAGRLFSVFCGVLTAAVAARLMGSQKLRWPALAATLLIAFSPVTIASSRELRMYALATLFAFASVMGLWRALRQPSRKNWVIWVALCLAAFGSHVLTAFVIAGQGLVVLLFGGRAAKAALGMLGLIMAGVAIFLISFFGGYGTNFGDRLNFFNTIAQSFGATLFLTGDASFVGAAGILFAALILAAGVAALTRKPSERWPFVFALIAFVAVGGIAAFCAFTGKFAPRYAAVAAPEMLLALSMTILAFRKDIGQKVGLVALSVVLAAAWVGAAQSHPQKPNEDFRGVAQFLRANVQPDEEILLLSGHFAPAFEYYFGNRGWAALPDDPVLNVAHAMDYELTAPMLNRALAGKHGAWLLLWQNGTVDPTGLTMDLLRRQSPLFQAASQTDEFSGLQLLHYRFNGEYEPLPEAMPALNSRVEQVGTARGLGALGCAQLRIPRAGDGFLEVFCFWQIKPWVVLPWNTQVSLRLKDNAGRQVLQFDQNLVTLGLTSQKFEKPFVGLYEIPLPADVAAGKYDLIAIPYLPEGQLAPTMTTQVEILTK